VYYFSFSFYGSFYGSFTSTSPFSFKTGALPSKISSIPLFIAYFTFISLDKLFFTSSFSFYSLKSFFSVPKPKISNGAANILLTMLPLINTCLNTDFITAHQT
jgi:hypothetical protein